MAKVGAALTGPPLVAGDPNQTREESPPSERQSSLRSAGSMVQGWHDWLTDPGNKAMLIQTGINMLQPHAPGQSQIGHTAAAIGAGFEARDTLAQTNAANALAQQKVDIEQQTANDLGLYRSAQADRYKALGASVSGKGDNARSLDIKRYLAAVKMDEILGKEIADRTLISDPDDPDPEIASLQAQRDANKQFILQSQAAVQGAIGTGDRPGTGASVPSTPGGPVSESPILTKVKTLLAKFPAQRVSIIAAAKADGLSDAEIATLGGGL